MPPTVSGWAWYLRVAWAVWDAARHEVGCRLPGRLGSQRVQEQQTSAREQRPVKTLKDPAFLHLLQTLVSALTTKEKASNCSGSW